MDWLRGWCEGCPETFWWLSILLTPVFLALLPVASPQKSGRS